MGVGRVHMAKDWTKIWPNNRRPEIVYDASKCKSDGKLKRCVTDWTEVTCPNCIRKQPITTKKKV